MKLKTKELWKAYSTTKEWENVSKTPKNMFCLGVQAVLLRGDKLLRNFFISKKENKWNLLNEDQQEQLIKEFSEWCSHNVT